jgi:hypothetical protein
MRPNPFDSDIEAARAAAEQSWLPWAEVPTTWDRAASAPYFVVPTPLGSAVIRQDSVHLRGARWCLRWAELRECAPSFRVGLLFRRAEAIALDGRLPTGEIVDPSWVLAHAYAREGLGPEPLVIGYRSIEPRWRREGREGDPMGSGKDTFGSLRKLLESRGWKVLRFAKEDRYTGKPRAQPQRKSARDDPFGYNATATVEVRGKYRDDVAPGDRGRVFRFEMGWVEGDHAWRGRRRRGEVPGWWSVLRVSLLD